MSLDESACKVTLRLEFEPQNRLLGPALALGMQSLADRMVDDFVREADKGARLMRIELLRAWPHRHESREVDACDGATVADALQAAGWALDAEFCGLAVFGVAASADTLLHEGDRVELLRALQVDPKQARRLRAERRPLKSPR